MIAHYIPKSPDGRHTAEPVTDSYYEERTALPANLLSERSYPVIAVCKTCHGRIRLPVKQQMEWAHVDRE